MDKDKRRILEEKKEKDDAEYRLKRLFEILLEIDLRRLNEILSKDFPDEKKPRQNKIID